MMNPYTIVGAVLLAVGLWFGGDHFGHSRGVDQQKVADQKEFDRIERERTEQKATANLLYRKAQDDIIALQVERDKLKTTLGEQDAKNRKVTADLSAKYSGLKLRFAAAQSAGTGANGGGTGGPAADGASAAGTAVIQLPDKIAGDLRRLARDADDLKDAYTLCYGYATKVK